MMIERIILTGRKVHSALSRDKNYVPRTLRTNIHLSWPKAAAIDPDISIHERSLETRMMSSNGRLCVLM